MQNISNTELNASVICPNYDRSRLKSRIVHLGFGAFHRAHQGVFTDDVARKISSDWGICEVSLFSDTQIKSLRQQDHLYSVAEMGANSTDIKVICAVTEALHPGLDGIEAVIEKMVEPQVAIVSLTITEKGYCIDPASGTLDHNNTLVINDLKNPTRPKSALGYIVEALKRRRERGARAFTVLSCDNIQGNGRVTKAAVVDFANLSDADLGAWIEENTSFPCTMVDRIVPAATDDSLNAISNLLGVADPCGITCEPFNQWFIEDSFVSGRPEWEVAGVKFVSDVAPYEEMKLRMLNGAHSFLAYLGYLAGYAHISDTMEDPVFRKAAFEMMMQNQASSLTMPDDMDMEAYANKLIERFANPGLKHKTWQIAMDGSQKIPQRLGGSLRFHLKYDSDFRWIAAGIAGWIRYVSGIDEQGGEIDVRDPMAISLRSVCDTHGLAPSVVPAILSIEAIFEPAIGLDERVVEAVTQAYQSLLNYGAKATVEAL